VASASQLTTLESLVHDYIDDHRARGSSLKTIESDIWPRLERIFVPRCVQHGVAEPAQLDQRAVNALSNHLQDHGGAKGLLSVATRHSYIKTVNAFLAWARTRTEGAAITGKGHKPKLPLREVEILTDAEVRAMLKAASPRDALIIQTLADSGIRLGEMVRARRGPDGPQL
jgi:integrase